MTCRTGNGDYLEGEGLPAFTKEFRGFPVVVLRENEFEFSPADVWELMSERMKNE